MVLLWMGPSDSEEHRVNSPPSIVQRFSFFSLYVLYPYCSFSLARVSLSFFFLLMTSCFDVKCTTELIEASLGCHTSTTFRRDVIPEISIPHIPKSFGVGLFENCSAAKGFLIPVGPRLGRLTRHLLYALAQHERAFHYRRLQNLHDII